MIAATIGPSNRTFISSWQFTQRLRSLTDSSFFWNPKCRRDGDKILIHDREHHSRINKDNRYTGIEKSDNFQIALLVQKARIRNSQPLFIKPESTNAPPSRKSGKPATSVIFRIFTPQRTTRREYRKFRAHCINAKMNRTGRIPLSPNIQ